jgi:prepilin-type processing-associated H-X9-DG protein
LVELLVVIGIIAVLMGVLVPTLAGARRSANNLKCAANLRSLGAAAMLYVNENRGHIPSCRAAYVAGNYISWYDQLAKYVFKRPATGTPASIMNDADFARTIFVGCPSFPFEKAAAPGGVYSGTGYGLNMVPTAPLTPPTPNRFNHYIHASVIPKPLIFYGRCFKLQELKNPTNRALMGDANGYLGLRAQSLEPLYYQPAPGNFQFGDVDYFRHSNFGNMTKPGANLLFCDGHVEICTPWQTFYAIRDPGRRAAGSDKGP